MPALAPFQRFLQRLYRPSAPLPAAARPSSPVPDPGPVVGRPSYDLGGLNSYLGPYTHVPIVQNYALYERLKEAVPLIDAAIVHITELVGTPCIEAEDDVKADIDDWLWKRLRVNQVQVGLGNFVSTWLDDMLTYGRSHAEIVLTNARDDIYGLFELHPGTIAFSPTDDGYTLRTVQLGRTTPLIFPEWKIMNAVHRVRTDDANGTSLLWGLPLVAECYTAMVKSQQGLWTRFGEPTFHINWEPPDTFNDPQGAQSAAIMGGIKSQVEQAMRNRAQGKVSNIYSTGTVKLEVVGAAGEELEFSASIQSISEMLLTKTGLPPMLLGLPWATTERMATVQSSILGEMVDRIQMALEPEIRRLVALRQALTGGDPEFDIKWEGATLQDKLQTAQSDLAEEEAKAAAWENDLKLWRQGFYTGIEVLRKHRPDLGRMDDAELKAHLPDLDLEPPEAPAPAPAGSNPFTQGNGANPGRNAGPNDNRAPQSQGKSLSYSDLWEGVLPKNGNGHR